MNPVIKAAIERGEAQLTEKKRKDQLKKEEEERERREYAAHCRMLARAWAHEQLPKIIEEETAKGNRSWSTHDKYDAQAARDIGLIVEEHWIDRCMDEGVDYGSYTSYTIHW